MMRTDFSPVLLVPIWSRIEKPRKRCPGWSPGDGGIFLPSGMNHEVIFRFSPEGSQTLTSDFNETTRFVSQSEGLVRTPLTFA